LLVDFADDVGSS